MLKELIHEKINEVFAEYQEANNIISGDISIEDQLALDTLEQHLVDLIERVCAKQPKELSSCYLYRDSEGIVMNKFYAQIDIDEFFTEISQRIAFADCSNEEILNIIWQGKEVEYAGWQPNMSFEYQDLDGKTVWSGDFPNCNH